MNPTFLQTKQLLENSRRIMLTTHARTDGDDLGSVLALAHHLQNDGHETTIAIIGGVPAQLKYLPGSEQVIDDVTNLDFDLLITSGCSNIERTENPKIINSALPILNVDHHVDNTNFGIINLVDPGKSAVAELVYDLFKFSGWRITPEVATCLLTGIFTDTGSFMHSNTKESTLRAAADLMRSGARPALIARHTYKGKNIAGLKAWGKVLENAFYDDDKKIIYSVITDDEMVALGSPPGSYFEGVVETLNKVPEAKFALFLKQDGDKIKGSLRSDPFKGIDVKKIASLFGGGGHTWASGFSVAGKLVRDESGKWQVVNDI